MLLSPLLPLLLRAVTVSPIVYVFGFPLTSLNEIIIYMERFMDSFLVGIFIQPLLLAQRNILRSRFTKNPAGQAQTW